ncbi:MAG: DNA polymerase III [Treponema sp.]|nr:DNA polymerase III [Treponema sp.]
MFDNIIEQGAALQLRDDFLSRRLAPSMLFFGPSASGKGSTALELARVLSCENNAPQPEGIAPWNCSCPACERHRYLLHGDLVILGSRPFAAEIAASRAAFLREPAAASRMLFIRSLRKLLARFSPAIWEYESRSGKSNPLSLLQSLEEDLSEFESLAVNADPGEAAVMTALEKLSDSLVKNALKLEDEGMGDTIPIAQIRRAAYWSRLAPNGRRKTMIIENADRMKEEAKNSLLKLLEEPPETLSIILCVQRREAILPTILSRLRPYRFLRRGEEHEREIIRRVYRDTTAVVTLENNQAGLISAYLDSFLPQSTEKLYPLAAFFIASLARAVAVSLKKKGIEIPAELAALGSHCGPIAEAAGLARVTNFKDVTGTLLSESGNFEARSFSRFIKLVLDLVSQSQREVLQEAPTHPRLIAYNGIWRKYAAQAETATGVFNQSPALALESFFYRLKEDITGVTV